MATDDTDAADDERNVELSSLEAIFPEIILEPSTTSERKARLDIEINLRSPLRVSFAHLARHGTNISMASLDINEPPSEAQVTAKRMGTTASQDSTCLEHLPALTCHMTLPEAYPENAPPAIRLECDPPWLSDVQIARLEKHAEKLWEDYGHCVMLFDYLDWLGETAKNAFDLAPGETLVLPKMFEVTLLDFDLQEKKRKFAAGTFDCGVCLEPKKGAVCHKMSQCGHVFCTECLQDYYNNCITEGDVMGVKCMGFGCEKERLQKIPETRRKRLDLTINPSELAEIPIEQEKIQRFVHLKQKKELESTGNAVFCPRKWCQGAARSEKKKKGVDDSDSEPEADEAATTPGSNKFGDRLAICSECGFAFCKRCLKGPWHGEHVACRPPRKAGELTEEEKATEAYLTAHSARCPTCAAPVQKTMGCNHMVCELCRTHFCYLCQAYLLEGNPYAHFNTPGMGCYQRLWVLEGGDDENAELAERIADDGVPAAVVVDDGVRLDPGIEEEALRDPPAAAVPAADLPNFVLADDFVIEFVDDTSSSEEDEVHFAPAVPQGRGARRRNRAHAQQNMNAAAGARRGRGRGGGGGGGGGGGRNRPARGPAQAAAAAGGAAVDGARGNAAAAPPRGVRAAPAPAQAAVVAPAAGAGVPPAPAPALDAANDQAIRRFVQMALHDQEDQWDSDELDSDGDEDWVIPVRGRVPN